MLNTAVLVSGGGTNLQAILDAWTAGNLPGATIRAVISNKADAYALIRAKKADVEGIVLSPKEYPDKEMYGQSLIEILRERKIDLVVLAGFLVILPVCVIRAFPGQIMNIHPSLIPSFCGPGYYGLKVHEAALGRGVKVTGATVHLVDEEADHGPILLQKAVGVQRGDTPEILQRRVMEEAEWILLPEAIRRYAAGEFSWEIQRCRECLQGDPTF